MIWGGYITNPQAVPRFGPRLTGLPLEAEFEDLLSV